MAKYRVKFNEGGRRKIVMGSFTTRAKAKNIARIINKRKQNANARVSRIVKFRVLISPIAISP